MLQIATDFIGQNLMLFDMALAEVDAVEAGVHHSRNPLTSKRRASILAAMHHHATEAM